MTKANDSGSGIWKEANVCYAPTPGDSPYILPEYGLWIRLCDGFTASCMVVAVRKPLLQMSSWHARGITVFVSHESPEQIRPPRELQS